MKPKPSCITQERTHGGGYICGSPESHEGYVHAQSIADATRAVGAWRRNEGELVYDADGDFVSEVSAPPHPIGSTHVTVETADEGIINYAYGEDALGSRAHVTYLLIPHTSVSPEEVEAAIESIRNTTI